MRPIFVLLPLVASAVVHGQPTSTRAGPRPLLPRIEEIALARSAAPPSVSEGARVLVLEDTGYVEAVAAAAGATGVGVTCLVNRSWRHSIEPHCYDGEGAASVMRTELLRNVLRHRGLPETEIDREIGVALASGKLRPPSRPSLTYMMSAAQVLYDDDGRRVGAWKPHVMIYYPYLTPAALGLGPVPDPAAGVVTSPGGPESSLMLIVPQFVGPAPPAGG